MANSTIVAAAVESASFWKRFMRSGLGPAHDIGRENERCLRY